MSNWASAPNFLAVPDVNCDADNRPELMVGVPRASTGGMTGNGSVLLYGFDVTTPASRDLACSGVCGDCTQDGLVNVFDAHMMALIANGVVPPPGSCASQCNVIGGPGSGITLLDGQTTMQFLVMLIPQLSCGQCP